MKSIILSALALVSLAVPVLAQTPTPLPTASPNELGCIPIIMYHSVSATGKHDAMGLNITPATFRKQLALLYDAGAYPINFRDVLIGEGLQMVPKGKTPIVLTFDDARESQFRYLKDGSIDPDCALGILEEFHSQHETDWPRKATFFVLPESKYNPSPFGQHKLIAQKLRYLAMNGYEVGNHSTSHHPMKNMDAKRLAWEALTCRRYVMKLAPTATMDTFCLPYGIAPAAKDAEEVLLNPGEPSEQNLGICLAGGDEALSPYDKRFNIHNITRFVVHPGYLEKAIARLGPGGRNHSRLYISDGNPTLVIAPQSRAHYASGARLAGATLVIVPNPKQQKQLATQTSGKRNLSHLRK